MIYPVLINLITTINAILARENWPGLPEGSLKVSSPVATCTRKCFIRNQENLDFGEIFFLYLGVIMAQFYHEL